MAKLTGKRLRIFYAGTDLSGEFRTVDVTEQQETADVTAGADDYRNFANTVKMIEVTAEIIMKEHGSGGSAILAAMSLGGEGTLIWGAEGTATGKPKDGFYARLVDRSRPIPFDDAYLIKAKWQMAGTALAFNGVTDLW